MKLLVSCSNAGEAGMLQSLLSSAGIDSELRDGRSDIGSIPSAELFVSPELFAQASDLIAQHEAAEPTRQRASGHPAEGFPFLGIMGFTAILWILAMVVLEAASMSSGNWHRFGPGRALLHLLGVGAMSVFRAMMIGAVTALVCLTAKVTWQKLRADPRGAPPPPRRS